MKAICCDSKSILLSVLKKLQNVSYYSRETFFYVFMATIAFKNSHAAFTLFSAL